MNRPFAFCCRVMVMCGLWLGPVAPAASFNDWVNDPVGEAERQVEEAKRLAQEAEQRAREAAAAANPENLSRATQASQAAASATQRAAEATASLGKLWEDLKQGLPTGDSLGTRDTPAFRQQAEKARASLQRKWVELQQQLDKLEHQSPDGLVRTAQQQAEKALAAIKNHEHLLTQAQGFMHNPGSFQQALDWFQRLPFSHPMPDILAMNADGVGVLLTYLLAFWVVRRLLFGKRR